MSAGKKSAEEAQPSIHITWSGDRMKHPEVVFTGVWDHRQIKALPNVIFTAFSKYLQELMKAGVGANPKPIEEEGE